MTKKVNGLQEILEVDFVAEALESIKTQALSERGEVIVDSRMERAAAGEEGELDSDFLVALQAGIIKADHVTDLKDDDIDVIKEHQELAVRHVQTTVKVVDGSVSDKVLTEMLRLSHVGQFQSGNLMIVYDVKSAGEDSKRPELRKPMLRKTHVDRLVNIALKSRQPAGDETLSLRPTDFIFLLDAGRHGNSNTLLGSVRDGEKQARTPDCIAA